MELKEITEYLKRDDLSDKLKKSLEERKELLLTGKIVKK